MSDFTEEKTKCPLCWPETWPRTNPALRVHSRFGEKTISVAWNFLHHEVTLLTSGSWLMSSNIPRSKRDDVPLSMPITRLSDPGVAVYFTFMNKPVTLACDKWLLVEDNIWAIGKHIEALRGQDRWGVGTLEQAFRGYMALPGIGQSSALKWWEVLGVAVNSSPEQVKEAYRILVKKHHPDRNGDPELFHRLQEAWRQFELDASAVTK